MRLASAMATTFTRFLCSIRDSQSSPGFRPRHALIRAVTPEACLRHDGPGGVPSARRAKEQEPPQIPVPGLRGAVRNAIRPRDGPHAQPFLAAGRMRLRRQARPGRVITCRAEGIDLGCRRRQRAGGQRADAGDGGEPARQRILGLGRLDPLRHLGDAGADVAELRGEEVQRGPGGLGNLLCRGLQPADILDALGHHAWRGVRACPHETLRWRVSTEPRPAGPELGQMCADRVHGLGLLADQEPAGLVVHQRRLPLGRFHRGRAGGTPAA